MGDNRRSNRSLRSTSSPISFLSHSSSSLLFLFLVLSLSWYSVISCSLFLCHIFSFLFPISFSPAFSPAFSRFLSVSLFLSLSPCLSFSPLLARSALHCCFAVSLLVLFAPSTLFSVSSVLYLLVFRSLHVFLCLVSRFTKTKLRRLHGNRGLSRVDAATHFCTVACCSDQNDYLFISEGIRPVTLKITYFNSVPQRN